MACSGKLHFKFAQERKEGPKTWVAVFSEHFVQADSVDLDRISDATHVARFGDIVHGQEYAINIAILQSFVEVESGFPGIAEGLIETFFIGN